MIIIIRKYISNKPYYYLTEQVRVGNKFKKIQVFIGKTIPNDLESFLLLLQKKEKALLPAQRQNGQFNSKHLKEYEISKLENTRIHWKYFTHSLSKVQSERLLRDFAIDFIFESNALEGSRLSQQEVSKIIKKQYIKKSTSSHEISEVLNSIEAFHFALSDAFKLNLKSLKRLHELLTTDLDYAQGFKKKQVIVNNKITVRHEDVTKELSKLFLWYKKSKNSEHPFVRAMIFHNRFEHIHPFEDGNGRTGRILLDSMLIRDGYGYFLLRKRNARAYRSALDKGDEGRYRRLLTLGVRTYVATIQELTLGK